MRRLDRYILREILGLLVIGFSLYTFLLLLQYLFSSAEMIIQRGVPAATVGKMLLLVLPSSVVMTIPMALLFAILIAIGRLSADSELVALRASGIGLMSLFRPIFLLSGLLTVLNAYLMISVLPNGNHALQQLRLEIIAKSVSQQVQPRVFHEEWEGKILYVFDIPPGQNRWKGVLVAQALPGQKNEITIAEWGEVRIDEGGERLVLQLENAQTHTVDLREPDSYNVIQHDRLEVLLDDRFTSKQVAKISVSKSVREMSLTELRRRAQDQRASPEIRNLAKVQVQKNFAIPVACLVFGLLALPLGMNNRRGGKTAGFVLSMAVILIYWILLNNGEEAARYGRLQPWIAMWTPNIIFFIAGFFLLVRRNRDKSLMLSRVDRWIRKDMWAGLLKIADWLRARKRKRAEAALSSGIRRRRGAIVVRLPRLRWRIFSLVDLYVVRRFAYVFLMVLSSVLILYIVADLGENADDILKNKVPRNVVLNYYKYLSLQILYDVSPIAVLVTTLLTFSVLSRDSELTAFKSVGISLFRLSIPAIAVTLAIVAGNVYLQSEILPISNQQVARLKNQIRGKEVARTYRRADRQWLFGQGRYIYNYLRYDPGEQALERLQVLEFEDDGRLARRLFAEEAKYQGDGWIFENSWTRTFKDGEQVDFEFLPGSRRSDFAETPEYFTSEIRPPSQMRYLELRDYIREIESRGEAVPELRVELQRKISYPAISLVMALVALPFAFRLGRQGALFGIGLSVGIGMIFMAVFIFFSALGSAGVLPPVIAVWAPNLVFATLALYLFLGVRT